MNGRPEGCPRKRHRTETHAVPVKCAVPIFKVTDIHAALNFYCSTLGFVLEFKYSVTPDGPVYVGVSLDGVRIHLSTFAGNGASGTAAYLHVDDVDGLFQTFLERGFKTPGNPESPVEEGPVDQTWGMREFYIRDPDGNTLCFGTPIQTV
ncbi:MAG: bleomycin resistance protein [Rhodospirillaceae bacterium]